MSRFLLKKLCLNEPIVIACQWHNGAHSAPPAKHQMSESQRTFYTFWTFSTLQNGEPKRYIILFKKKTCYKQTNLAKFLVNKNKNNAEISFLRLVHFERQTEVWRCTQLLRQLSRNVELSIEKIKESYRPFSKLLECNFQHNI